jgi:hypothetical protein
MKHIHSERAVPEHPTYEQIVVTVREIVHEQPTLRTKEIAKEVSARLNTEVSTGQVRVILTSSLPSLPWHYDGGNSLTESNSIGSPHAEESSIAASDRTYYLGLAAIAAVVLCSIPFLLQHSSTIAPHKDKQEKRAVIDSHVETYPALTIIEPKDTSNPESTITTENRKEVRTAPRSTVRKSLPVDTAALHPEQENLLVKDTSRDLNYQDSTSSPKEYQGFTGVFKH